MRRTLLGLAAVGIALMMVAPSAMAVHGSPYVAKGKAYIAAEGTPMIPPVWWFGAMPLPAGADVYDITVEWTGWWTRSYNVEVTDAVGNTVYDVSFLGREYWPWGNIYQNQEILWYNGESLDPNYHLDIKGIQTINMQTQQQHMMYTGTFQEFGVILFVEDHVNDLI